MTIKALLEAGKKIALVALIFFMAYGFAVSGEGSCGEDRIRELVKQ